MSGDEPKGYVTPTIADHVAKSIDQMGLKAASRDQISDACLQVLRGTFYASTEKERIYLSKLSRTCILLFTLKNDPRIVEYFRSMSTNLELYVGTDIIIRAISEYFLRDEDRMTWNMLSVLKSAGSRVILTDYALQEVITHLIAADNEFRNFHLEIELYITRDFARHINQILIRAYFYARLGSAERRGRPAGWKSYVELFCTYDRLHLKAGRESLMRYLCEEFGFEYETQRETLANLDNEGENNQGTPMEEGKRGDSRLQRCCSGASCLREAGTAW